MTKLVCLSMSKHTLWQKTNSTFCFWNSNWDISNVFFLSQYCYAIGIGNFFNPPVERKVLIHVQLDLLTTLQSVSYFPPVGICSSNLNAIYHQLNHSTQIKSQNLSWFKLTLFYWLLEHFGYFQRIRGIIQINLENGLSYLLLCVLPFQPYMNYCRFFG